MCVSPISIKNPNWHNTTPLINLTTDTESQFIYVPCGVCSECLMKRQSDIVQRSRCLSLDHYIFFCTLTYNNESLPHVVTSTGFSIAYADICDVQKMFKRIRKANLFTRDFKYFFVSERGKKGRPHFHGLIFIPKYSNDDKLLPARLEASVKSIIFDEWRRNYGSTRKPIWKPLFTYRSKYVGGKLYKNFDCHYVAPHSSEHGSDDVAFYVTKYVLKPSKKENDLQKALHLNLDEYEYNSIWPLVKSRCFFSKGFGASTDLERDYVRSCIDKSQDDPNGFQYINADGSKSSLSRYYRKFIDLSHGVRSVSARGGPYAIRERKNSVESILVRNSKIISKVSENDISEFVPED